MVNRSNNLKYSLENKNEVIMINFSDTAIVELKRLREYLETENSYVRIKIAEGGCADYVYQLTFDNNPQKDDHQFKANDEIQVVIDDETYPYVKNLKIDYTEDLMGGAFQFKNIDIRDHCTCGLSFYLKS